MRPGKRFGPSATEKSDIWRRWKAGQTLHEIGAAPLTSHILPFAVCCSLAVGFPSSPSSLPYRTHSCRGEDISRGIASGSSIREIARHLKRATSTVSREVNRLRYAISYNKQSRFRSLHAFANIDQELIKRLEAD